MYIRTCFWFVILMTATQFAQADCYDDWQQRSLNSRWYRFTAPCVREVIEHYVAEDPDRFEMRVIGHTPGGVEIPAIRVTNDIKNETSTVKPTVLLIGGIHAEERSSIRSLFDWLETVHRQPNQQAFTQGKKWRELFDDVQVWVVPRVNMETWGRSNAKGINLNRDFPYRWSKHSESDAFPASQPETRAIMGFASTLHPDVVVSAHGHRTPLTLDTSCPQGVSFSGQSDNWFLSGSALRYRQLADGTFTSLNMTRLSDLPYLTLFAPNTADSLARLSEIASGSGLKYAPYASNYACDGRATPGMAATGRETRGYMEAQLGAVGVLLEHLRFDPEDIRTNVQLEDPEDRIWFFRRRESEVLSHTADTHAGYGRLLEYAARPINNIGSAKLAVQSLSAPEGNCNKLETFWPASPESTPADDNRLGQFGTYTPTCFVSNRGSLMSNGQASVNIAINDLSAPWRSSSFTYSLPAISPGGRAAIPSRGYRFRQNHRYSVTCELVGSNDRFVVEDDAGCYASGGTDSTCVAKPNGRFDAIYDGWAQRSVLFEAVHDADETCIKGERQPVSINGNP